MERVEARAASTLNGELLANTVTRWDGHEIADLRDRYGEYVSCRFDETKPAGGGFGQPSGTFHYVITFDQGTLNASTETIFADQNTGEMVMQFGSLTIEGTDSTHVYPAAAP